MVRNLVRTIMWNPLLVMYRAGRSFFPVILLRLSQSITDGFEMKVGILEGSHLQP
jgi:hypothetical protein